MTVNLRSNYQAIPTPCHIHGISRSMGHLRNYFHGQLDAQCILRLDTMMSTRPLAPVQKEWHGRDRGRKSALGADGSREL